MAAIQEQRQNEYVLGHSNTEIRRLQQQGDYLRPLTQDMLRRAGLAPGMRVLDFGSGSGDVAFAAAEIVGPTGEIIGFDRAAEVLAKARARAAERGITNVQFFQGDETVIDSIKGDRPFDAVIGRLVLVHQRDPGAVLKALVRHVRPGGIVAFHEIDQDAGCWSQPHMPLLEKTHRWLCETFARGGMVSNGARIARAFEDAGVQSKRIVREAPYEDGSEPLAHVFMAETMRTVLPFAEKLGVTTAAEVQIDTLRDRLAAEANTAAGRWVPAYFIAAWGQVPN